MQYYSFDDGSFFLVATNTAVNFIAKFIFPLIFNMPFINAEVYNILYTYVYMRISCQYITKERDNMYTYHIPCCGCTSFRIILPITSSLQLTTKSALPSNASPSDTEQFDGEDKFNE